MLTPWLGVLASAGLGGSFAVPARKLRVLPWNGAWLIYCIVAKVLIPCTLGLLLAPAIFARVFPAQPDRVALVLAAGLAFGCGSFLFGVCVDLLGVALSNAIVSGMVALVGSMAPILTAEIQFDSRDWSTLCAGLLMLCAGLAATCRASLLRDATAAPAPQAAEQPGVAQLAAQPGGNAALGVSLALLAGCFSSMLNVGFVYGQPLRAEAIEAGVPEALAILSVWIPVLAGAFIINLPATCWRLRRAGEFGRLARAPASDLLRAAAMGALWIGGLMCYGGSAPLLGREGLIYSWAIVTGGSILFSLAWGIALGEWSGAGPAAKRWLAAGIGLMLVALAVLSLRAA